MKNVIVALLVIAGFSMPAAACEMTEPADLIHCYQQAVNDRDIHALAELLAHDYSEAYVSQPNSTPLDRDQAIDNWDKIFHSDKITQFELVLGGDIRVSNTEDGLLEVTGITSTVTMTTTAMDQGQPGSFSVDNWASWWLRPVDGGFQIVSAKSWTHEPE